MINTTKRIKGALFGAVLGDIVGVPYEFQPSTSIPELAKISIHPSSDEYSKTYPHVPYGTWSDDTSTILCSIEAIRTSQLDDLASKMISLLGQWRHHGLYAVDGKKFDIGIQTASAIDAHGWGTAVPSGLHTNGNGALMRAIGPALCTLSQPADVGVYTWRSISETTHPHPLSTCITILLSCLIRELVWGIDLDQGLALAHREAIRLFTPEELAAYQAHVVPKRADMDGAGYVVETFLAAVECVTRTSSTKSAIQLAVSLGGDTDTTASVAGAISGCMYGFDCDDWWQYVRERVAIEYALENVIQMVESGYGVQVVS